MFAYVMSDRTTIWAAVWRPFDAAILVPVWPTVRATIRTAHQLTVNAAYLSTVWIAINATDQRTDVPSVWETNLGTFLTAYDTTVKFAIRAAFDCPYGFSFCPPI
jgi:hypothetical protein